MTITSFKQLESWKSAHKLVLAIYQVTDTFPKYELFGLTNQIRRAAVSVNSNIAEGFGRIGKKEKLQFFHMSLGSLLELENQLEISKDLELSKYCSLQENTQSYTNHRQINQRPHQVHKNQLLITSY